MKTTRKYTVLHLCAAHVLKAISSFIKKHVTDKGHREFLTFVFARLQKTQNLNEAIEVFSALCIILLAKKKTNPGVKNSPELICLTVDTDNIMLQKQVDVKTLMDFEESDSKTLAGKSTFSCVFWRVCDDAAKAVHFESNDDKDNMYYCPAIVQTLPDKYMPIYPLWSGALMLGNLSRHTSCPNNHGPKEIVTRDTNPHAEAWFGIVKYNILLKKKCTRPLPADM